MSHTFFDSQFKKFTERFGPSNQYIDGVTIKMTMAEMQALLCVMGDEMSAELIYNQLSKAGYLYEPIEFNGTIGFYWLVQKAS